MCAAENNIIIIICSVPDPLVFLASIPDPSFFLYMDPYPVPESDPGLSTSKAN
jgi:hypothetical protein